MHHIFGPKGVKMFDEKKYVKMTCKVCGHTFDEYSVWDGNDCGITIKFKGTTFMLSADDILFDNSFCYQVTTRKVMDGFSYAIPVFSTTRAKKLIKLGALCLVGEEFKYKTTDGKDVWYRYYKISG